MCMMWVPIGDHLREHRNERPRHERAPQVWPVIAMVLRAAMGRAVRIAGNYSGAPADISFSSRAGRRWRALSASETQAG